MGTLLFNVFWSGLADGLSATMITTTALVLALYCLRWTQQFKLNWFLGVLVVEIMLFGFFAHLYVIEFENPGRIFTLLNWLMAGGFLVFGLVLVWDWFRLNVQRSAETLLFGRLLLETKKESSVWIKYGLSVMIFIAALTVTVQDMQVPMAPYMVAITNNIFANVMPWICFFSLCLYSLVKFWLVWLVMYLFSRTFISKRIKIMIVAAFFLAAGVKLFI